MNQQSKRKNFRKRNCYDTEDGEDGANSTATKSEEEEEEHRMALEEVKFLQKQRERRAGIPALPSVSMQTSTTGASGASGGGGGLVRKSTDANSKTGGGGGSKNESAGGEGDKDDLVLQDTFAQETAVMVEDPNMLKYIEQELAKKRGRTLETVEGAENDLKQAEDELYKIPEHLKVKRRNSNESSTQWTTGIAEVQLPIEFKLKNIEETEAAKKLLQEKRFVGRSKSEFSIPSSFSADYFHRGRDYAEKLRREHPELYKGRNLQEDGSGSKPTDTGTEAAGQRQAATDEFMLERFRKRERHRGMRR
ncbi:protein COP1 SUPPRESSOR 2 [Cucurbita pepo subsp. pepo]|uniref:protein COP1 SUPPRESSOR 2 n=1 Tax=Cucurbita pepo subsp. pepo TaxID=3664 RepID=UPI000C9D2C7C|nr:protein COP1 SUPPRESSOR 2 [Cucurbita pepo subsp. pepo]